jgi:predicted adenylyl cyclase CyaB
MRNIELKAQCADLGRAEAVCRDLGARRAWTRHQVDTYFDVPDGRLKLRVESPGGATLISYQREDTARPRECVYSLTHIDDPQDVLTSLVAKHGVRVRVCKTRTLYLLGHLRIHLDDVDDLGTFIEFEAVMAPEDRDTDVHRRLGQLLSQFAVSREHILGASYADLLERPPHTP